jgi:hypothetical protein
MEFEQRRPDVVRAISQRALLAWWGRLRANARVPAYAEATPEYLAAEGQNLMHCDVVPEGDRLRFRMQFIGARLAKAYGGSWPGRFLDEALPAKLSAASHLAYGTAVERGAPVYSILETVDRDGRPVHYERLILPFCSAGETADRIVTSVEMLSDDGAFDERKLMVRKPDAPTYLVNAVIDTTLPAHNAPAIAPAGPAVDLVD